MVKKYFCDYCNKTMSATATIIKTHKKGIIHQKLVSEHYKQFKDIETILEEESHKKPCSKYLKGECQFGAICRFSHYTREEIYMLQSQVAAKQNSLTNFNQPSFQELYDKLQIEKSETFDNQNTLVDQNGITHVMPWNYNHIFESYSENLPPSLKRFKCDDFLNISITEWGKI